jgi:putative oxidoreductase
MCISTLSLCAYAHTLREELQMDVGLFVVHLVIGSFFLAHGAQHALGLLGGGGISGTGQYMESVGLRHGRLAAAAAGGSELVGGALLVLGFATPLAAALLAATMLVAARTDHRGKGFWIYAGGAEYVLTNAVVVVGLAFNGAGRWSLDRAIGWHVAGLWWGVSAAAAALIGAAGALALLRARQAVDPQPA